MENYPSKAWKWKKFHPFFCIILNIPLKNGGDIMNQQKELIIKMLDKIDDASHLKRIYDFVHRFFIRRTG